jgi:DNA-binding response OmpR family regulator
LVKPLLAVHDFVVTETQSAGDTEVILSQGSFDLLIICEELPDKPGSELIKALKASNTTPIAYVSFGKPETEKLSRLIKNKKIVLILQKPLQPAVFSQQIANYLEPQASTPKPPANSQLPEMLALLRTSYIKEIPQQLEEIAQSVKQAIEQSKLEGEHKLKSRQLIASTLRKAHTLSGTSGTYGFIKLSKSLADIEQTLHAVQEDQDNAEALWNELLLQLETTTNLAAQDQVSAKQEETPPAVNTNSS